MLPKGAARKVTIFVNEDTQHHFGSLSDAILTFLLHKGVAGATATRAMAGFGAHRALHAANMEARAEHLPIRIEFVESASRVDELMPTLYDMVSDGLIEVQDTHVVKSAAKDAPPEPAPPRVELRGAARLMRIYLGESDRWHGEPLYEAIVKRLRLLDVAGATVFRGLEGFGETAELHRRHLLHRDQPIVVTIVDSPENIARLIPELEPLLATAVLAVSDVEAIRIEASPAAS